MYANEIRMVVASGLSAAEAHVPTGPSWGVSGLVTSRGKVTIMSEVSEDDNEGDGWLK